MKSVQLTGEEQRELQSSEKSPPKHSENARKIQRLLKKRREMLAEQKLKTDSNSQPEKPQKPPRTKSDTKDVPKSEPTTSDEPSDEDEHPETLTENSESYDSNDSLQGDAVAKELEKG